MKLYKKYVEEKYGRKIIEDTNGFVEYKKFEDGSMYIYVLFIEKGARNQRLATSLVSQVVEKESPTSIYCDIDLTSNDPEAPLTGFIIQAGFKIFSAEKDRIILFKEIK